MNTVSKISDEMKEQISDDRIQNLFMIGIDRYGSFYGPIRDQYVGNLIFEKIYISPRTILVISNAPNHNGMKTVIENTSTDLKEINLIDLMKRGEIDRCVSYKILLNTDQSIAQGINGMVYVMILIIIFLLIIIIVSWIRDIDIE